jgi:hypothetical protein
MASATRKDLLKKVYNMVPPMLESFHKGTELSGIIVNYMDSNVSQQVNWAV